MAARAVGLNFDIILKPSYGCWM